jgi:hypothetical protein
MESELLDVTKVRSSKGEMLITMSLYILLSLKRV